jgi:hypothetical protein
LKLNLLNSQDLVKMSVYIGIAYYEKKDWGFFLSVVDDRESVEDTWNEWYKFYLKSKEELISTGFSVSTVKVDINELIDYCIDRKIKNDSEARSQFVAEKLKQLN